MNRRRERLAAAAALALGAAMIVFTFQPALSALRYRPGADPLWMALPAQLVHLGPPHLLLNLSGLALMALVARRHALLAHVMGALLVAAVGVAVGLRYDDPPLAWYVGLSGALYGAVAALGWGLAARRHPGVLRMTGALLVVGVGIKTWAGIAHVGGPGEWLGIPPAPSAHLYGYLGGLAWSVAAGLMVRRRP
ncbi:rhomboid family intramembrane serine protease [Uliginosibacterium sp. sgz301328]|uniref:rhomboid family intramembrane serine protease n=1 Tax=Uliginosibacterium sp. sgz301328 TaxID=3243764 RepID=UPI00359DBA95